MDIEFNRNHLSSFAWWCDPQDRTIFSTRYALSAQSPSPNPEVVQSNNSLTPREPYRVPLETVHTSSTLDAGETLDLSLVLHAARTGENNLYLLLTYREVWSNLYWLLSITEGFLGS